jgi:hypothetical protein
MAWQRARCDTNACIEVNLQEDGSVSIRNSNTPSEVLSLDSSKWAKLIDAIKQGAHNQ